ncbi:helix-turn-helix domain-containing protein [Streptococcus pneumoniae]|uniref:helix-turn-helix domain-containing protein n=1 Tax=Streptococcus pneumoniae TaxID=1313 RepID=UPI002AC36C5F|nr:helix-turn-helix transcriptional regulator [Streptococcus pneumoniae]
MRYDFGKVYKEIRESKGLTQEEVCGGVLSRTSLSKIESGKTTPKYENMEFLLRQINMSFEEFEYICQLYQPSQRTEIMQTYLNMRSIIGTSDLVNLFQKCQDYLKTHHDLPIEEIRDMLEVVIYLRQHGAGELSKHAEQVVKKLWKKIEKQDTWYESDLKILNTILFSFPIEYLHLITGKILQRLEVYKNYQHLYDLRMTILLNLMTFFSKVNISHFFNDKKEAANRPTSYSEPITPSLFSFIRFLSDCNLVFDLVKPCASQGISSLNSSFRLQVDIDILGNERMIGL